MHLFEFRNNELNKHLPFIHEDKAKPYLLNLDFSFLQNTVDPDQLASDEASWSGSTLFSILLTTGMLKIISINIREKEVLHITICSMRRVKTLKVPIATKVVCFSCLLKCLRSLFGKQCGPRSCSGSTLFASILNLSVMLGNYLQQTTTADDIFRCIFFLEL